MEHNPAPRDDPLSTRAAGERLGRLEQDLLRLRQEVRTRRLVVTDGTGTERMVAEVRGSTMELRLLAGRSGEVSRPSAVLYVTEGRLSAGGDLSLGPAAGLQLWAEGDAVVELDTWPDESGHWHPHLHLGGGG